MPDGAFDLEGRSATLAEGRAFLSDGTIAGAAVNLFDGLRNAIRFGIRREDAVEAATITPARRIGMQDRIGAIAPGCYADFIVCDDEMNLAQVYLHGVPVYPDHREGGQVPGREADAAGSHKR